MDIPDNRGDGRCRIAGHKVGMYLMMWISFPWSLPKVLDGSKTSTLRQWKDVHAAKFGEGDKIWAYDKNPRNGGERKAVICLTCDPFKVCLGDINGKRMKKEGHPELTIQDFKDMYFRTIPDDAEVWCMEFELMEVL